MAQALSATALSPERSFELARLIEKRLDERGEAEIDVGALHALAEEVLRAEEGETAAAALPPLAPARPARAPARRADRRHDRRRQVHARRDARAPARREPRDRDGRDPPGAARLLHRTRRCRRCTTRRSRSAGSRATATRPSDVGTGIAAIVDRAADEGKPVVVEGVHVVPGGVHPRARERCVLVEALVVVDDPDLHRGHFSLAARHAAGRALPVPLRGDPPPPGPPLGARPLGGASR